MFKSITTGLANTALNGIKERVLNPNLEGIGVVREILYKDGAITLTVELAGLENAPITVRAGEIKIAPDGSYVTVGKFESDKLFMNNALNRFVKDKPFTVPEGGARLALQAVRPILGLK